MACEPSPCTSFGHFPGQASYPSQSDSRTGQGHGAFGPRSLYTGPDAVFTSEEASFPSKRTQPLSLAETFRGVLANGPRCMNTEARFSDGGVGGIGCVSQAQRGAISDGRFAGRGERQLRPPPLTPELFQRDSSCRPDSRECGLMDSEQIWDICFLVDFMIIGI